MSTSFRYFVALPTLLFAIQQPLRATAQVPVVNQLVQASRVQALHYRQYGRFSASTSWLNNVLGGLSNSHYYVMNANNSAVLMNALPRNSQGFAYVAGVFLNTQGRNLTAVICQSNQPGRNLPPRPGLTTDRRGQVVAACRIGSTQVTSPLYF